MTGTEEEKGMLKSDDINVQTAHAMNRFYEEIDELYREAIKKSGLSQSAFDILYALYEQDGRRLLDLGKASFLSKQTLASSVKRLKEQGLVRTEAQSRRHVEVYLTKSGHACIEESVVPVIRAEIRAINTLTPQDQALMRALADRYTIALREEFDKL